MFCREEQTQFGAWEKSMPSYNELKMFQNYPLDLKIAKSSLRIREFYSAMGGQIAVSFSGGKDNE